MTLISAVFTLQVSVAHCSLSGEGVRRARVGTPATAQLTLRGDGGRALSQPVVDVLPLVTVHWLLGVAGQTVDVAATQATGLTLWLVAVGAAGAAAAVADQVEYCYLWPEGTVSGPRRLRVLINGIDVPNSPFTVQIAEKVRFTSRLMLLLLLLLFLYF
jgi:hypothetical protein